MVVKLKKADDREVLDIKPPSEEATNAKTFCPTKSIGAHRRWRAGTKVKVKINSDAEEVFNLFSMHLPLKQGC